MKQKNLIPAILAGAAVGTILGILFAPKTGKDTRNELLSDCNSWLNKFGKKKQVTGWNDNEPVEEKAIPNFSTTSF